VYSGLAFGDMSAGAIPLIVDLGWRFLPQLYLGAYGQVAPVVVRTGTDACPDSADCSGVNWRIGVELDYHPLPASRLDPYVGVGAGYEMLHRSVNGPITVSSSAVGTTGMGGGTGTTAPKSGMTNASIIDQGWEMAAVTLGLDVRASDMLGIGPFVTGTFGRYDIHNGTQSTVLNGGAVTSGSVPAVSHDVHQLLIVGVRGTFNP
jgi:hypothetical protein